MAENGGVEIQFLSTDKLKTQSFDEKVETILDAVQDGKILVLEQGMTPDEKITLMQRAMEIADDDFPGIEFSAIDHNDFADKVLNRVYNVFGRERRKGLTIVGNADVMETVDENPDMASIIARDEEA